MKRANLKFGVYRERSNHSRMVSFLEGPDRIWITFNGTNYPSVMVRTFNQSDCVKLVMTETQFRDRYEYVGRYTTVVTTQEVMS